MSRKYIFTVHYLYDVLQHYYLFITVTESVEKLSAAEVDEWEYANYELLKNVKNYKKIAERRKDLESPPRPI